MSSVRGPLHTPISFTLINYAPGEANLTKILAKMPDQTTVIKKLHLDDVEKIGIESIYPDISYTAFYSFFSSGLRDLAGNQEKRLNIFNKIKHGGVIVSDGRLFSNTLHKAAPAAIYADKDAYAPDEHLLTVHGLKYDGAEHDDTEFILMQDGILRIATMIKALLALHLCVEYPELHTKKGLKTKLSIFEKIEAKKWLSKWNGY